MARRPEHLIYSVDEKPPLATLVLLSLQHVCLMSSTLVLPIVLVTEIGGTFDRVRSVVAFTMISCGVGTALQAVNKRNMGSGYLCPNLCGPNFFTPSMEAAWLGGIPLMRGMTIVAGLVEIVFARLVRPLRFLFPPAITGLVVLMVAESLVPLGTSKLLGVAYEGEPIRGMSLLAAVLTLAVMVGISVRSRGRLRLYSVLLGLVSGYVLSLALGLFPPALLADIRNAPWIAFPSSSGLLDISFRWELLPTFLIVSVTGALKSFGNLIMCEKVNDDDWKEPEMDRISGGLVADGLCVTLSGLLGGMASDTSASNVALSRATRATSRSIGFWAGGLFVLLGLSPKISSVLSAMPIPVMGAVLVFVTCFMIMSGLQIIVGQGADDRTTFVVGVSFIFGLSLDILPALYADAPHVLRPLFSSPLTLATVLAVLLNQLLRTAPPKTAE